jgi:small-conductance mechanosensitive channel
MNEISSGNLKINGFYADWAEPTYLIMRVLCYSFMIVMIWPLLPSSNSEIFQGISVFIGVIISLGSSSIIGNVMAGMVMTYMRPFREGDFIRYGDTEGFVIEKTLLVTRIRTRKNDVITIPNSNLMTSQTHNYTRSAEDYGIVVHTKVTIGYDMPWKQIRQLLIDAAKATPGIEAEPEPFVIVTSLDDFYVEYEINAYTRDYQRLPVVYTGLRQNILDNFHHAGVEIMSPHIYAHRQDLEVQIPKES